MSFPIRMYKLLFDGVMPSRVPKSSELLANRATSATFATLSIKGMLSFSYFTSSWCLSLKIWCRYVFLYSLRADVFLSMLYVFLYCLQCSLSRPYLGNARRGPSPSWWPALITLPTLAKFPLVWRRLCDVMLFPSCLVEHTLTATSALLSRGSSTH